MGRERNEALEKSMNSEQITECLSLMEQNRFDEAIAYQKRILETESGDILPHVMLGNAYRNSSKPVLALIEYETAISLFAEGADMNAYLSSYSMVGIAQCKIELYEINKMTEDLACFPAEAVDAVDLFYESVDCAEAPDEMYVKAIELSIKAGFYLGGLELADEKLKFALAILKGDSSRPLAYRERLAAYAYSLMTKVFIKDVDGEYVLIDSSVRAISKLRRYCNIIGSYIELVHGNGRLGEDAFIVVNYLIPWRVVNGSNEPIDLDAGGLSNEILEKGMFDL
jgi:tetratricopeptide (TPR) repeat protein